MEILAIIISLIALAISVLVAVNEYKRDYEINRTNLESVYFNEIYKEFLLKSIPNARKYIRFDNDGMLRDTEKMRDLLNQIRHDSLYYFYNDQYYYDSLKTKCQELEDFLLKSSERSLSGEEQTEFYKTLQDGIKDIYKAINNKLLGKKQVNNTKK